MKKTSLCSLVLTLATVFNVMAQKSEPLPLKHGAHRVGKRADADMQRWREYGLGQFIHWGVYAIPGGVWNGKIYKGAAEWIRSWRDMPNSTYDSLYLQFNPASFDAKRWAKQAKQMGARYLVFTTKHHDGFCLWNSQYTDYTVASTPYKKDIVREVVDAYTAEGIDVHLYFSIIDWHHPDYQAGHGITPDDRKLWAGYEPFRSNADRVRYENFKTFTRNQLVELLTNFPTIKGLWFDGSWDGAWMKQSAWVDQLGEELRAMRPGLIIGSRFRADELGNRHTDANGNLIDDYDQRFERNLPASLKEVGGNDWDCVMTIPENQWGYHRDWSWTYVKKPYELIEMLVKANSLDGNFVINFGPDGNGNIRKEEADVAAGMGAWMAANGEAIYGTHHSLLDKQDWGYSTQRGDSIYLVVFNKPLNNLLRIKIPKTGSRDDVYVIAQSQTLDGKPVRINGGGKPATYYRDKSGSVYYDLVLPVGIDKAAQPFVIRIRLKKISTADLDAYQEAII
ncbi:MAG: alpha-L-fucosidase [Prevotellaceae bacterium]|jgi:alpha-L-fucosidase|nr:alpha-L-fucosidase [Prevotellaceae bacterium]